MTTLNNQINYAVKIAKIGSHACLSKVSQAKTSQAKASKTEHQHCELKSLELSTFIAEKSAAAVNNPDPQVLENIAARPRPCPRPQPLHGPHKSSWKNFALNRVRSFSRNDPFLRVLRIVSRHGSPVKQVRKLMKFGSRMGTRLMGTRLMGTRLMTRLGNPFRNGLINEVRNQQFRYAVTQVSSMLRNTYSRFFVR